MSNWNAGLISEVRYELFGWYYQLHRRMKINPDDKEDIDRHIAGFMENYIVLKRLQKRWKPEWDEKCEYSQIKTLYRLVVD